MTFTLRESSSAIAVPTRASVPAADPWDAPYFGGRVYFSYYPALYASLGTLPTPALSSAAIASPESAAASAPAQAGSAPSHGPASLGLDPWDAPYFGGPVYFHYPAFPVSAALASPAAPLDETPAPRSEGLATPSALPDPPAAPSATPGTQAAIPAPTPRRGWLARLFRAG